MGPNELANVLRRIATAIENSRLPSKDRVAADLKKVLGQVAGHQTIHGIDSDDLKKDFDKVNDYVRHNILMVNLRDDELPDYVAWAEANWKHPFGMKEVMEWLNYNAALKTAKFHGATRPDPSAVRKWREFEYEMLESAEADKMRRREEVRGYHKDKELERESNRDSWYFKDEGDGVSRAYPNRMNDPIEERLEKYKNRNKPTNPLEGFEF